MDSTSRLEGLPAQPLDESWTMDLFTCNGMDPERSSSPTSSKSNNYDWKTEVLAASIRHPIHVMEAARVGADVATMPFKVMAQLINHPLTETWLQQFLADWRKAT